MDPNKIKAKVFNDLLEKVPELIEGADNFTLRTLKSKKNLVFDLTFNKKPEGFPKKVVLKLFRTDYFEKEYNALIMLEKQQLNVPKVIYHNKPYLILEKLPGINLCDFINDKLVNVSNLNEMKELDKAEILDSLKKLAEWLAHLHKQNFVNENDLSEIIVFNKGDTRLRDFLYDSKTKVIYGLDFEESYEGNYLDDLAWICCSLLDTDPGIFEIPEPVIKIELINCFLNEYFQFNKKFKFSFSYFANRLIENLNIVIERRKLELSPVRKKVILGNISKRA